MKLCLSIAPNSMQEAISQLRKHRDPSDLIEVRIDGIHDLKLERLLRQPRPRLIITNRRKTEGGKFTGSADRQFEILSEAIDFGAEYIDVEQSWGNNFLKKIQSIAGRTKIILSYHNYKETPDNLFKIYNSMRKSGFSILKIATTANDILDNKKIFSLLNRSKSDGIKLIGICMDEFGQISRILGGVYGGYLTFASPNNDETTASGQISYDDMDSVFNVGSRNRKTKIFGLIGNPVKYSQGIYYHNDKFRRKKCNAVYVNFLVNDLTKFLKIYRDAFSGFSITMPFKKDIVTHLDKIDNDIKELNIVNTVLNKRGKLSGYNTDFLGLNEILKKYIHIKNKKVIVIGTGAISKTMAYSAISNGADVTIIGRSLIKAKSLAKQLGCNSASLNELLNLRADLLMNGTSVGMKGANQNRLVPKKFFQNKPIVFDAVYNPVITPLLHEAQAAGCKIISGKELFETQAKFQSDLFMSILK
ncbi:MAG: type I 3-dehydroquinate dehydratase [Ignavibacteriales bacterium]|nr:type I 3-dehydroquinate dehydratase [Ignavibacteriales bacterium]